MRSKSTAALARFLGSAIINPIRRGICSRTRGESLSIGRPISGSMVKANTVRNAKESLRGAQRLRRGRRIYFRFAQQRFPLKLGMALECLIVRAMTQRQMESRRRCGYNGVGRGRCHPMSSRARWQATRCPGTASSSGGTVAAQTAIAKVQRSRYAQPAGRGAAEREGCETLDEGRCAARTDRGVAGANEGTAANNARV